MGRRRKQEYVVICRELNRKTARIDITVIDSGVTEQFMKGLVMLHMRDPHKRYFLANKTDYQKYGALMKKQVEAMSIQNNKKIVELGGGLG
ncbi:MAG: hypothetical protein HFH36_13395 [Lachnospiraceae bacterium]|nr:hypothetical protein [Lachnospiraceae bacterium]